MASTGDDWPPRFSKGWNNPAEAGSRGWGGARVGGDSLAWRVLRRLRLWDWAWRSGSQSPPWLPTLEKVLEGMGEAGGQ